MNEVNRNEKANRLKNANTKNFKKIIFIFYMYFCTDKSTKNSLADATQKKFLTSTWVGITRYAQTNADLILFQ